MESSVSPFPTSGASTAPTQAPAGLEPDPTVEPDPGVENTEPDPGTYADDEYSRQQLVQHSRTLLGADGYIVEVALRHAGGQDQFTVPAAKAAVAELLNATVEV